MNIALVGTAAPYRGGIAHWNMQLAAALAKHHTVSIYNFRRQYPAFLFPGTTQFETGEERPAVPAPRIVDSINPWNWVSVGRRIRLQQPDLLIFRFWLPFFGPCFGTIARVATRGTKTRVLCICDNVLPHERRPFDRLLTRYLFKQADFFIVQSDSVEKDLLQFWPGARYRKAPHPVYDRFGTAVDRAGARARLGIRARNVILFFGYVRAYKGLDVLINAMPIVAREHDVELVVAGEFYDDRLKYEEQIRAIAPDGLITLHPEYASTEKVRDYFSAADVVVLPYRSATQSGIAQIAFNFDVPVIASDVGGLGEVVKDGSTGYVVPPDDAEALGAALSRFFREGAAGVFVPNIREEKKKYTWEQMIHTIEDLAGGGK